MDQFNTYSKSFTPINNNERSSTTTYGEGYVYTGPLTAQYYEIQSKAISEITTQETDEQNIASSSSSSPSINNLSLSTSPSTEVLSIRTSNQYQFKVMLLGDSGVGKFKIFIYRSICFIHHI